MKINSTNEFTFDKKDGMLINQDDFNGESGILTELKNKIKFRDVLSSRLYDMVRNLVVYNYSRFSWLQAPEGQNVETLLGYKNRVAFPLEYDNPESLTDIDNYHKVTLDGDTFTINKTYTDSWGNTFRVPDFDYYNMDKVSANGSYSKNSIFWLKGDNLTFEVISNPNFDENIDDWEDNGYSELSWDSDNKAIVIKNTDVVTKGAMTQKVQSNLISGAKYILKVVVTDVGDTQAFEIEARTRNPKTLSGVGAGTYELEFIADNYKDTYIAVWNKDGQDTSLVIDSVSVQLKEPCAVMPINAGKDDNFHTSNNFIGIDVNKMKMPVILQKVEHCVTDTDFAFIYGNLQFTSSYSLDLVKGKQIPDFEDWEKYTEFYEGFWNDTDLRPLGYKWSNLLDEDREKFIKYDFNNLYYKDNGKLYESCYRIKVLNPYGVSYKYERRLNMTTDIIALNELGEEIYRYTDELGSETNAVLFETKKGNAGIYHPELNPMGSAYVYVDDDNTHQKYDDSNVSLETIDDCFNPHNISVVKIDTDGNKTYDRLENEADWINTGSLDSGLNDFNRYDVIYYDYITDLRMKHFNPSKVEHIVIGADNIDDFQKLELKEYNTYYIKSDEIKNAGKTINLTLPSTKNFIMNGDSLNIIDIGGALNVNPLILSSDVTIQKQDEDFELDVNYRKYKLIFLDRNWVIL